MDYLTFDLRIGAGDRRTYPVSVIKSPAGEASAVLQLHLDDPVFQQSLQALENVRGVSRGPRHADALPAGTSELTTAQVVGRTLFEVLFTSEVLSCYRNSLAAARAQKKHLRIRLRVEAPELSILPWEFLYDAREGDYVSLLRETPVTRYLEMGLPADPLTIQPPIRILGMVASPNDLPLLDATLERRRMAEAIDHLVESRTVELKWVEGQTWRDLARALQEGEWHIFHFIGHGGFSPDLGEGLIALADETSGGANFLSATQLGRLFAAHPALRLAILNACEGARASEQSIFSSTGAVLARRGIPAVVSMQFAITDRAAIEFSRTFYDGLARGLAVDGAVQEARIAISMALGDSVEWGTPVLYMRAPDGTLFHVDLAGAIFRRPAESPPATATALKPAPQIVEPEQPARPIAAATGETRRGLDILLRKVRQYWIDGVLEKSLFQAVLIDLGMQRMQNAVDNPWAETPWAGQLERPGAESQPLAPQQTLADVFEEEGGSLLILGEPGSGKTTSMLELTRGLLARAEDDPLRPVPVVCNLSAWTAPYTALDDWLAAELSARYQIPRKIAQGWLAESRLLLLLDGLDELSLQRRAACVEAINRFTQDRSAGTVVCCRLQEYIDLPARLSLNAAVRLLPLSDEQVQRYLAAAGERLTGLRGLLQRESAMRIEARSPLMLSLMSRAYQDVPADQLLSEGGASAARRKQLMDAYVARMFRRAAQGRGG